MFSQVFRQSFALFWLLAGVLPAVAQEAPVFQAGVNGVPTDTLVTRSQRPLKGLRIEDFVLLENGQPRPILSLTREELPLDIVVVCPDYLFTFGLTNQKLDYLTQRLKNALAIALTPMRPEDRAAIVIHGADPRIELPLTSDRNAIAAAIRRLDANDPKAVAAYPTAPEVVAMEYGVRLLEQTLRDDPRARTERRRLILKISGLVEAIGGMWIPPYADETLIRRLWSQNIILSSIVITVSLGNPTEIAPTGLVDRTRREPVDAFYRRSNPAHVARATGGEHFLFAIDPANPPDLLTPIRQRYVLWFDQPENLPPGQERTISVDLSPEARKRYTDAVVQARQGYVTR